MKDTGSDKSRFAIALLIVCWLLWPTVAVAEVATEVADLPPNPYSEEIDAPVPTPDVQLERWHGLSIPVGWWVGETDGYEVRVFGPSGTHLWLRITPDRQRIIWALNYFVYSTQGYLVQRTRVGESSLLIRTENPRQQAVESTVCADGEHECQTKLVVSLNWPLADESVLSMIERQLQWLTDAIQADQARLDATAVADEAE
ncbi:MAG: hypothetical protein V1738_04830 [Patescibacteria group bacterium]